MNLADFYGEVGDEYQAIGKLWKENWDRMIPFFAFPQEVRKSDLHDQCGGGIASRAAEDHQERGALSE